MTRSPSARHWTSREKVAVRSEGGPVRVVTDQPDPTFRRRPAGFVLPDPEDEPDPDLWDGDQA